ncbi:hypothetical protein [Prescottella equi]|uniref:hypothetical protein n=1 Tax=Rhodococcus hoagii TaxID=43767 RepID=UPI000A10FCB8|nr:hypothetical protein [Prescottella equi]ORL15398.1 hypothetical protein A6I85_05845 [Prescottella equi]
MSDPFEAETGFYVGPDDQREIVRSLRTVPELVEQLSITISRQDRIGSGGPQISSSSHRERPVVYNEHASTVSEDLRGVLVGWVRHVLEYRELVWNGDDSTLNLARWLDRNVIALAMTPGSEEMLDELRDALRRVWRAIDLAPERSARYVDDERVAEASARAQELRVSPAQAEALVEKLGYKPLKAATVRQWAKRGKIEKGIDGLYRLGDILRWKTIRGDTTN